MYHFSQLLQATLATLSHNFIRLQAAKFRGQSRQNPCRLVARDPESLRIRVTSPAVPVL
jgi:hypothetical protein